MATVNNAYTTKQAKNIREQLESIIHNVDPTETPVYNLLGNRSVGAVTFDYLTEHLPARGDKAPQVEGYINSNSAPTPVARNYGTTMLLKRDATTSGDLAAADTAGYGDARSHALVLAGKALRLDFDEYFSGKQARQDDNGTLPGVTEGFLHALKTNVSRGAGGAAAVDAYSPMTAGTARPLDENIFDDVMQAGWFAGSKASIAVVGGYNKRVISKFVGRINTRVEVKENVIALGGATILQSDFGDVKVVMSRNIPQDSVLILDPEYAKRVTMRPINKWTVAKNGDADTDVVQGRIGLQVSNELAHLAILDLTTSK